MVQLNREGYFVGETHRECTKCGTVFLKTSLTVTLCGPCNGSRVKGEDPVKRMYRRAKARASLRGMPFTLELEDVVIPTHCPILGMELEVHKGSSGGRTSSPTLDRINNDKGYVKGNVWVISQLANMMKSCANPSQLISFAKWVDKMYPGN